MVPKHPKLAEYSLGIAMLFGIACALILGIVVNLLFNRKSAESDK